MWPGHSGDRRGACSPRKSLVRQGTRPHDICDRQPLNLSECGGHVKLTKASFAAPKCISAPTDFVRVHAGLRDCRHFRPSQPGTVFAHLPWAMVLIYRPFSPGWVLFRVGFCALLAIISVASGAAAQEGSASTVLTEISEIRSLAPAAAERGLPVRVRGVATYFYGPSKTLVVQSGADSVYVDLTQIPDTIAAGQEVEVYGVTGVGSWSPVIVASRVSASSFVEMPAAERISTLQLSSGTFQDRFVEVEGIIQSSSRANDGRLTLLVASGDAVIYARVNASGSSLGDAFIGSSVAVRGVASTTFDVRRRAVRLQVLVTNLSS